MRVLFYRSQGTDDMEIVCRTVEEAINCFRADAGVILGDDGQYDIELWSEEMSEEQLANVAET